VGGSLINRENSAGDLTAIKDRNGLQFLDWNDTSSDDVGALLVFRLPAWRLLGGDESLTIDYHYRFFG
jgi:hypothetical protein